jgi:hypothetical protein
MGIIPALPSSEAEVGKTNGMDLCRGNPRYKNAFSKNQAEVIYCSIGKKMDDITRILVKVNRVT